MEGRSILTTPSVWIILAATFILIIGTLVWAVSGKIRVNTESGIKEVPVFVSLVVIDARGFPREP